MKGRTVNFFIEPEALPEVLRSIDEDVLPRYRALPHFVGVVVLQSQRGTRVEVAGISLWDGDLEDSEEIAAEFRREVHRVAGTGAARTEYEVIRLELREGASGYGGSELTSPEEGSGLDSQEAHRGPTAAAQPRAFILVTGGHR